VNGYVDLRSDTVTTPTDIMRRAMSTAEVGDDCYGEDPTVNRLQDLAASMLGTEAALFVPTGTMANQIAIKVLSHPGHEVICESECHLIHHESGAAARLSQVQLRGVPGVLGVLDPADVEAAVRPADPYQPKTSLVAVENTHNTHGGTVWSLQQLKAVRTVAHRNLLPLFCDGARLFNACAATGVTPAQYASEADVVTISLYKCLSAPMGSLVCGRRDLVDRAWLYRRVFGGALRQAGIVAAAGIVALETMIDRLPEDHERARELANGLVEVAPVGSVPLERVHTNMVLFEAGAKADAVLVGLRGEGVLAGMIGPGVLRFVTHKDVDQDGIARAVQAFAKVLKEA
jgi:threonine aldolase